MRLAMDFRKSSRNLAGYLHALAEEHGDVVFLPIRVPTYMIGASEDVKHVLVTKPENYHKTGGLTVGKELLGEGLLSSGPRLHAKQRRVMQPMFHRKKIASANCVISEAISITLSSRHDCMRASAASAINSPKRAIFFR
jgi:cytochrome P450